MAMLDVLNTGPRPIYVRSTRTAPFMDGHPALCALPSDEGYVQCNRFGTAREWEEWTVNVLARPPHGRSLIVGLRSYHGRWLSAKPCGRVFADGAALGAWETWTIELQDNETFAFRSHHGKYLCCVGGAHDLGKWVCADRARAQGWEQFLLTYDCNAFCFPGSTLRYALIGTGYALTGVGAVGALAMLAIPAVGFGVAGVGAGSIAAGVQSAVYGGATSGAFSMRQAIGATSLWVP